MTVQARISGNVLRIKIPLQEPKVSGSGKNKVIATTSGVKKTGIEYQGSEVYVIANAFIPNPGSSPKPRSIKHKEAVDHVRKRK